VRTVQSVSHSGHIDKKLGMNGVSRNVAGYVDFRNVFLYIIYYYKLLYT